MKRKVLVEGIIETDETGKYCGDNCRFRDDWNYCNLFNVDLKLIDDFENPLENKRCTKCIKAEVIKP
jgi:hypothetical protein